ncbi:hypothetical protein DFH06DRAFT_1332767 [Mycena polygramma]|nr:hypothetical protein DFH06DRAFT_1332767 [Mycena polygramma]
MGEFGANLGEDESVVEGPKAVVSKPWFLVNNWLTQDADFAVREAERDTLGTPSTTCYAGKDVATVIQHLWYEDGYEGRFRFNPNGKIEQVEPVWFRVLSEPIPSTWRVTRSSAEAQEWTEGRTGHVTSVFPTEDEARGQPNRSTQLADTPTARPRLSIVPPTMTEPIDIPIPRIQPQQNRWSNPDGNPENEDDPGHWEPVTPPDRGLRHRRVTPIVTILALMEMSLPEWQMLEDFCRRYHADPSNEELPTNFQEMYAEICAGGSQHGFYERRKEALLRKLRAKALPDMPWLAGYEEHWPLLVTYDRMDPSMKVYLHDIIDYVPSSEHHPSSLPT